MAAMLWSPAGAAEISDAADLVDLSLEELLNMEITTLSRKAEDLGDAPAAVFVISQKDIQRSGARTIPDLLRMVPGMQVAQIDGNKWAVTARGANGRFANKLLVLMDGRTLYSPLLSGVYWDVQDTDLAAIDRIEVIRGPGATMWGANAVNGVVNIITKDARNTVGGDVHVLGGNRAAREGLLRYGSKTGDAAYRVYLKGVDRDGNSNLGGEQNGDSFNMARAGARADWSTSDTQSFMLSAEVYDGKAGETRIVRSITPPYETTTDFETEMSGAFALFRWNRDLSNGSNLQVRSYISLEDREGFTYSEKRETFDIDVQHSVELGDGLDMMWGVAYRESADETTDSFEVMLDPLDFTQRSFSGFIQGDIFLMDDRLRLILGSKFEHTNLSHRDLEVEPSIRFSMEANDANTVWGAVSRAIRVPSRGESSGTVVNTVLPPGQPEFPLPVPLVAAMAGNPGFKSEEIVAYELGFRHRRNDLYIDVAVFLNDYDKLRSVTQDVPTCQPDGQMLPLDPACVLGASYVQSLFNLENGSTSTMAGAEIWVSKQATDWWHLQAGYTYIDEIDSNSNNALQLQFQEDSPPHQLSLRSSMDLPRDVDLDLWLRYVDELELQMIDAYTALDVRVAWSATQNFEIAAVGRNLIAGTHQEFVSELGDLVPVAIEPEAYVELRWSF
jgi:iron complex outermembrane receptor protein